MRLEALIPRAGWRRWAAGIGFGVLAAAAMPPFNFVPVLLIAFPGLIVLTETARSPLRAFNDGWRFGFGYLVPTLHWTMLSLFVDIGQFWFLVPFALFLLPAFLALYTGAATALTRALPINRASRIIVLAAGLTVGDWLRGHMPFGGFPWALWGYVWSGELPGLLPVLQSTALFGIWGLSFLTVLAGASPALLLDGTRRGKWLCVAGLLPLIGLGIWGQIRLIRQPDAMLPGITLRIVQPNNPQTADWAAADSVRDAQRVLQLAASPGADKVSAQIWPESAIDFFINRDENARLAVASVAPTKGAVLFGTMRVDPKDSSRAWNSVGEVDAHGALLDVYDKAHLVPFGEYVPLRSILQFNAIVAERLDFATGPGPRTLKVPGLPAVSPIICYEAIFPHAVVDEAHRPGWIVNVTNDAWFGLSTGPYQHFAISRVRAVEEGLPLLRAGNSGISGLIDPHGRILAHLALGERGFIDVPLPRALPVPTFYARFGDAVPAALILLFLGLAGAICRRPW